jgi:branched-chain amino acid transport system ATP-binding protein
MLAIHRLHVLIQQTPILVDVNVEVAAGAIAGLVGRNGAGKTTLMRSIMGLIPIAEGRIELEGKDLAAVRPFRRAHLGIGYMPEDRRLIPDLSVEENVLLPGWATDEPDTRKRLDWVYGLLPEVAEFAARRALQLSGGQQKLVALARALMCGRRLLLLDEPFEGVAPVLARRLVESIDRLRGTGLSVLLSESDYTHSADLVSSLFVIERGVVREQSAHRAATVGLGA